MNKVSLLSLGAVVLAISLPTGLRALPPADVRVNTPTPGGGVALDVGVVRRLPKTEAEVVAFHQAAEALAATAVPTGEPLEIPDFKHRVAYRVSLPQDGRLVQQLLTFDACRRSVLSAGAEMTPEDQRDLPFLSGSKILDIVNSYYLSVQVRVHRHEADGVPHLYHVPFAAVTSYKDPHKAQEWTEMVRNSVREIRSLGLYVKPNVPATPDQLRTLFIINRNYIVTGGTPATGVQTRPNYEFMIVRARPAVAVRGSDTAEQLELHTFVTSHARQNLNYLGIYRRPQQLSDCTIRSIICFTEFGFGNLYPTSRVSRRSTVNSRITLPWAELEQFVTHQGWSGDALDNLTELLDAMIDGRLVPAAVLAKPAGR
jgi:hypothetical protein